MHITELPPGADRIELLQTFVRIVETGSLSAAAAQLAVSQPSVSRRLQTLERQLGVKLLRRSTHGMKLTEEGDRCLAHARELLDGWEAMAADVRGSNLGPKGRLRVLVPHALGQQQLIAPLTEYLSRYPDMSVEWLLHDRRPDFVAEGVDCAIQVGAVEDPSVVAVKLAEIPRIVVAPPAVLPPGAEPDHPSQLASLPWLALHTYYRDEVCLTRTADGEVCRFPIRPRLSTDSVYALRRAALAGLGACIVSGWVVQTDLQHGRLCPLVPDWRAPSLPVYLVYPHARSYPARLRLFLEAMRSRTPELEALSRGQRHG